MTFCLICVAGKLHRRITTVRLSLCGMPPLTSNLYLFLILHVQGFLSGAFINIPLTEKLGFGKMIVLGEILSSFIYGIND